METGSYLELARRWWSTLLVALCVGALMGLGVAATTPSKHISETKLLVGPVNGGIDTLRASSQLTRTYADLAMSESVVGPAIREASLGESATDLIHSLRATGNEQTRILTIEVGLPNADDAARLANAVAASLTLATSQKTERPEGLLTVIEVATPGALPETSRAPLLILLAAMGGLLSAVVVVLLLERFDTKIRDPERLEAVAQRRALGVVAVTGDRPRRDSRADLFPPRSDVAYSSVFAELIARSPDPVRSMMVVSAGRHAVSSAIGIGLARAAANVIGPVRLVQQQASLREPTAAVSRTGPSSAAVSSELSDDLILVGASTLDPRAYGDATRLASIRDDFLVDAHLLVVDGGPVAGSVIASMWAHVVDVVLVCVLLDVDERKDVLSAFERLDAIDASRALVLGARYIPRLSVEAGSGSQPLQVPRKRTVVEQVLSLRARPQRHPHDDDAAGPR